MFHDDDGNPGIFPQMRDCWCVCQHSHSEVHVRCLSWLTTNTRSLMRLTNKHRVWHNRDKLWGAKIKCLHGWITNWAPKAPASLCAIWFIVNKFSPLMYNINWNDKGHESDSCISTCHISVDIVLTWGISVQMITNWHEEGGGGGLIGPSGTLLPSGP